MFLNQSESLRLDTQLRGWFKLDPITLNKESGSSRSEQRSDDKTLQAPLSKVEETAATTSVTSLGHLNPPVIQGVLGGIYQMLINDDQTKQRR